MIGFEEQTRELTISMHFVQRYADLWAEKANDKTYVYICQLCIVCFVEIPVSAPRRLAQKIFSLMYSEVSTYSEPRSKLHIFVACYSLSSPKNKLKYLKAYHFHPVNFAYITIIKSCTNVWEICPCA